MASERAVAAMSAEKMKRQTLRRTISLRPSRSTRLTVISASFALPSLSSSPLAASHDVDQSPANPVFQREQPDLFELLDFMPSR